jgi:hypothetical protein
MSTTTKIDNSARTTFLTRPASNRRRCGALPVTSPDSSVSTRARR